MNEMFCPKCGQQQLSEDVRFCSRCGFQMHVITHLLEKNGALAGFEIEPTEKTSLYKRIISSAGAKLIFVSIVIAIFFFLIALFTNTPQILTFPFFLFVIGTAMIVYKLLFGEQPIRAAEEGFYRSKSPNKTGSPNELPPLQNEPVSFYESPRRTTGELIQPPPSVTEPTTKLLEQDGKTNEL